MTVPTTQPSGTMHRCEEVRQILFDILGEGLLRIRAAGWAGRSEDCANEADHLHNLPETIRECTLRGVRFYYDFGRRGFIHKASAISRPELFDPYWERLKAILIEADSENRKN